MLIKQTIQIPNPAQDIFACTEHRLVQHSKCLLTAPHLFNAQWHTSLKIISCVICKFFGISQVWCCFYHLQSSASAKCKCELLPSLYHSVLPAVQQVKLSALIQNIYLNLKLFQKAKSNSNTEMTERLLAKGCTAEWHLCSQLTSAMMVLKRHLGRKVLPTQWSWDKSSSRQSPPTNKPSLLQTVFLFYYPIITQKAKSRSTDAGLSYKTQISFPITPLPQELRGV